jgi:hypothetical protein
VQGTQLMMDLSASNTENGGEIIVWGNNGEDN